MLEEDKRPGGQRENTSQNPKSRGFTKSAQKICQELGGTPCGIENEFWKRRRGAASTLGCAVNGFDETRSELVWEAVRNILGFDLIALTDNRVITYGNQGCICHSTWAAQVNRWYDITRVIGLGYQAVEGDFGACTTSEREGESIKFELWGLRDDQF